MTEAPEETRRADQQTNDGATSPHQPEQPELHDVQAPPVVSPEADAATTAAHEDGKMGSGRVLEGEALQMQLADAQAKAAEYLDGWQRARAEFANFRRRADKERDDIYQNATVDVYMKLLPVIDDFERAFDNVPADRRDDDVIKGFGLIHRKLVALMEAAGVEVIDPKGQPFDPNYHEAIGRDEPSAAAPVGHVTVVLQKGYQHAGRVLRPALVRVAQ